jgi:hypothetical protein
MRDAGPTAPADGPGLLASSVTTLRLIAGWACGALGVLNLSMGMDTGRGTIDHSYLAFHVVLLITGLALLSWGPANRSPRRPAWLAAGLVTVLGPVLSALPAYAAVCCLGEFPVRHGFPFTLLAHGAGGWHADGIRTLLDLLFWVCVGFLVLVVAGRLRRADPEPWTRRHSQPAAHPTTHSADLVDEARAPRDENVGGLP